VPESRPASRDFDFFLLLYAVSKKPGLYIGLADEVQLLAAIIAGYFIGKKYAHVELTKDEKAFHRFGRWMSKRHGLKREYPWHRLVKMWPCRSLNSFQCFFENFDNYLTDFGKNEGALDDLFETLADSRGTAMRRKSKKPKC
jgi:uncharacterized protein YneF (UPF0154 family)